MKQVYEKKTVPIGYSLLITYDPSSHARKTHKFCVHVGETNKFGWIIHAFTQFILPLTELRDVTVGGSHHLTSFEWKVTLVRRKNHPLLHYHGLCGKCLSA